MSEIQTTSVIPLNFPDGLVSPPTIDSPQPMPSFDLTVTTVNGARTVTLCHGDLAFNTWFTSGWPIAVKHWAHSGVVVLGKDKQWYVMEQVGSFQLTPLSDIKQFTRGYPDLGFARINDFDNWVQQGKIWQFVNQMFNRFKGFGWMMNPLYWDNRFQILENPVTHQQLAYCTQEEWLAWYDVSNGLSLDNLWQGVIKPDAVFEAQEQLLNVTLAKGCY